MDDRADASTAHQSRGENRDPGAESNTAVLAGYITRDDLARQLGLSPRTLERWERERTGPPCTRIKDTIYYHVPGVRAWLAERTARRDGARAARQRKGRGR